MGIGSGEPDDMVVGTKKWKFDLVTRTAVHECAVSMLRIHEYRIETGVTMLRSFGKT